MFRLFNNIFKSYPFLEIKNGQHLDHATEADYDQYFAQKEFSTESQFALLFVGTKMVYWGEIDNGEVAHKHFYKTPKEDLEREFSIYDEANDFKLMARIQKYIEENLQEIDGAKFELLSADYDSLMIQEDHSFLFMINAHVNRTAVVLDPPKPTQETLPFKVVVNSHDFKVIKVRMS